MAHMTDKNIRQDKETDHNLYTKKLLKHTKYSNNINVHCTVTVIQYNAIQDEAICSARH